MQLGMPDTSPWNLHIRSIDTDFSIEIKSPSWDIDILSGLFGLINRIIEGLAVISIVVWRSSFRNNIDSIIPLSNRVWSLLKFHKVKAVMDVVWPVFHQWNHISFLKLKSWKEAMHFIKLEPSACIRLGTIVYTFVIQVLPVRWGRKIQLLNTVTIHLYLELSTGSIWHCVAYS